VSGTRPARDAPLWIAGVVLLALPVAMAFRSGGYGGKSQLLGAGLAFVLLALVALTARWPLTPGGWPLVAAGALTGYAVWTGLSIGWAASLDRATQDTSRVAMYATVFVLGLAVMQVPAIRRITPVVLLVGVLAVCLYALGGRLLPHVIHAPPNAGARLSHPLTYWNSMGMFAGFGVLLGVAGAGDPDRSLLWRAFACAAVVPCALACFLTLSRGAILAVVAGLVLCAVLRRGRATVIAAACGLGATAALGLLLNAFPAVLSLDRGDAAQVRQGAVFLPIAVAVALATGFLFARLVRSPRGQGELPLSPRARSVLAIATVPVVLAVVAFVAGSGEEKTHVPSNASRITTVRTNRGHYWRVALDAFARHPLDGIGTASFATEWERERGTERAALDAHSLYLETLAELGVVGALLLLAFIAATVRGVVSSVRAGPPEPALVAGVAVLGALAIHLAVDWDWEMPAVILPALILAAAAVQTAVATRPEPRLEA
jgi:O-antigen ligase